MPHGAQLAICDPVAHARAISEFTTGERIVLSRWWSGLPRLRFARAEGSMDRYIERAARSDGCMMLSWRARDAPIFTLAYRGREAMALQVGIDAEERSHTILFSHSTGDCYVARRGIHLGPGDPHMLVQYITEAYTQREGLGYNAERGVDAQGLEVDGGAEVLCSSLKVIDVDVQSALPTPSAKARAGIMQAIGQGWERVPHPAPCSGDEDGCRRRRGIMWCGELRRSEAIQALSLRHTLRHTMQSLVILTTDPYLQVLIPVQDAEGQLQGPVCPGDGPCLAAGPPLHPRLLGRHDPEAGPGPCRIIGPPVLGPLAPAPLQGGRGARGGRGRPMQRHRPL